jgi:hypothetical protein
MTTTQYHTIDVKRDDTRDDGYDLYAAIGVCRKLLSTIYGSGDQQAKTLQQLAEELASSQDTARQFVAQRRG